MFLFAGTCLAGHASAQPAGGPPIDPRAMSGIPRADPQTEPGTITVRALLGSFSQPAVGVTVELELKSQDGSKTETRTAVAGADGRASFADLSDFHGGTAVARADLDGERQSSQPITVTPAQGYRVLLVKGAGSAGAAPQGPGAGPATAPSAPPGAQHGQPDVPLPGVAFVNPGTPKGTLLVGTLDLRGGTPLEGVKVRLVLTAPDGKTETREAVSDARGTSRFPGLDELAADIALVAEADLPSGTERSQPFSLAGKDVGMAVVLAVIGQRAPQKRQMMGPRAVPTISPGTVRVTVVGPDDQPINGIPVAVVKQDSTGFSKRYEDATGEDGVARVADIPITGEGLFHVEASYAGAPWKSSFFTLDERMGVAVEMRVYPITTDLTRVRSAVQFGVESMENDLARVDHLLQVFVDGDAAYWPGKPYKLNAADGATGLVVRDRADQVLEHDQEAPFTTITGPLPPGELIDLSTAYLLEHDGTAEIRWAAPFPIVDGRAVVVDGLKLTKGAKKPPVRPPHENGESRVDLDVYEIGAMPQGQAYDLVVDGLVTRPRTYKWLGLGFGLFVAFACGLAFALRPRTSLRDRLLRRKALLLRKLEAAGPDQREPIVAALDQVYCQLDALESRPRHADPGAAWQDKA
jgi:5-hydroxyisourate hydrolase-like protein (transthyretin family)